MVQDENLQNTVVAAVVQYYLMKGAKKSYEIVQYIYSQLHYGKLIEGNSGTEGYVSLTH